jgi:hypothetical protein
MIFFSSVWVNPTKLLGFRRVANKLLSAEPSSKFLSSMLMIGHPEIICCPKLDHLGKKGGGLCWLFFTPNPIVVQRAGEMS